MPNKQEMTQKNYITIAIYVIGAIVLLAGAYYGYDYYYGKPETVTLKMPDGRTREIPAKKEGVDKDPTLTKEQKDALRQAYEERFLELYQKEVNEIYPYQLDSHTLLAKSLKEEKQHKEVELPFGGQRSEKSFGGCCL